MKKIALTCALASIGGCATLAEKNAALDEQATRISALGRPPEGNCSELGIVGGVSPDYDTAHKLMLREAARKGANYVRLDHNPPGRVSGMAYHCIRFLFDNPFKGDGM